MIVFDLQCDKGHAFEGWFEDSQAFNKQKKKGLITCPSCNSTAVSKLPSTFAIKSTGSNAQSVSTAQVNLAKLGLGNGEIDKVDVPVTIDHSSQA